MDIGNDAGGFTAFVGEQKPEGQEPATAIISGVEIDFDKREIRSKGRIEFSAGAVRGECKIVAYLIS